MANTNLLHPDVLARVRTHVEAQALEKAGADPSFRDRLKSDPHGALKTLLGINPIPGFKISVVEEQAGEVVLVLPHNLVIDELPDELLDLASGGGGFAGPNGNRGQLCPSASTPSAAKRQP